MSLRTLFGGCIVAGAAVAGCYTGGSISPSDTSSQPSATASVNGTQTASSAFTGLPCDVAQVLATSCASCHGPSPSGGAPNAMMTYEDLVAASTSNPSANVAEVSVARMKDGSTPMPPEGANASDTAVLEKWVAAGLPQSTETCDVTVAPSAGAGPSVCTSGTQWTRGNRGSAAMRPGVACISCHSSGEGPSYAAAGTVYATAHEPDDCNGGTSSSITVEIVDATNKKFTASVNAAGNFYFSTRLGMKAPYKTRVISGSKSRSMTGTVTNGDCNTCHTEAGSSKAPGRVMAP